MSAKLNSNPTSARRTRKLKALQNQDSDKIFNDAVAEMRVRYEQPTFKEIVQRGTSDPIFEHHFTDRACIVVGNWKQSRSQQHVRSKYEEARMEWPGFKPRAWATVCKLMFHATRVIETITEAEELRSWVLSRVLEYSAANFEQADKQDLITHVERRIQRGFFYDSQSGVVYLKADKLTEYLNQQRMGRKFNQHSVVMLLQRHGFVWRQKGIRFRDANGQSCFHNFGRFWRSPEGYIVRDEDRKQEPEEFTKPRKVIAASKHL